MPAKSKAQQAAMAAAYAAEKGDMPKSRLRGASKRMLQSMRGTGELRKFAKTKKKGLPEKVSEGHDDASKLGLGKAGFAYARMAASDVMNQPGGTAKKVFKRYQMVKDVTNQNTLSGGRPESKVFPSMDKAGKVPHAIKGVGEHQTPQQVVSRLLEEVSPDRIQFIADQFGMEPDEVQTLSAYDPSGGKYLTWIVNQVRDEKLRFPEDGEKVMQRLEQFQKLSRKPNFAGERDLNRYDSYGELVQVIDQNAGVKTKGEVQRTKEQEGVRLLKTEGDSQLFEVTSPEAAAKLFRHTEWCVKDPKWFNHYEPARFFYLEKGGKPLALFHPESGQLKDVHDADVEFRVPLLEPYILQDAARAYWYAHDVIKGRWPEAEPVIMQDAVWAYFYARDVIKGRWPEAEPVIMQSAKWARIYRANVARST